MRPLGRRGGRGRAGPRAGAARRRRGATPRDLSTWSAPAAGGLAWRQRACELAAVAAAPAVSDRALRELLALQSSDWAFLVSAGTAGEYPAERAAGHAEAFAAALADPAAWRRRSGICATLARDALAAP